jgi:hypothetical protein
LRARNNDPVLRSSFREMLVVVAIWVVAAIWSIGYSYLYGYVGGPGQPATRNIQFIFGFPDWVFWAVIVPWLLCSFISLLVSLFVMRDEDLGVDPDEEELFDDA